MGCTAWARRIVRRRPRTSRGSRTLPSRHQLRHRADRVFDRRLGIDAVLVIESIVLDARAASGSPRRPCEHRPGCRRCPGTCRRARAHFRTWWRGRPDRGGREWRVPTSSSLRPTPYMSAVSRNVDPSSSARCKRGNRLSFVTCRRKNPTCPCSRDRWRRLRVVQVGGSAWRNSCAS